MGLYQLKEFLTLDDVADYLRDKGVYDFDLHSDYDRNRLESWLLGLHRECRISFLYYFSGRMKVKKVVSEIPEVTDIEAMQLIANINTATIKAIEQIEKGETPTNIIPNFKTERLPDIWVSDYIYLHGGILSDGLIFLDRFAVIRFYNNKQFHDGDNIIYRISEENSFIAKKEDLLIPKAELDEIFDKPNNQHQIADLQAENARLQAENTDLLKRIAELESQTNITTLPNFDNSDFYTYPPELDKAIKIWYEIYQTDNLPKHFTNHSEKFTQACKNLGFKFDVKAMMERIKTVTTPQKAKEKTKNKNRQN